MGGRLYLKCLGQPTLISPTGESIRFRTKKHLALLVYLVVDTKYSHRRDRLAELLWPNVPHPEARHSLATALSILRPRLGQGAIEATRDQVVLSKNSVDVDLDRLLSGDILATETKDALEVAGFLEGFDIPGAAEFGLWKDRQNAKYLPAIKRAIVQLIDQCRRTADSRQIEHLADSMLALDELSEEAIRAKMEARAFSGDRLTALRVFEDWKTKLSDAVGAQPSDLVEGMAVRLRRRGWERTTLADIPVVRTDQWRDRSFVGRSVEYRKLYEAWEATRRGHATHALVLGDSGIGKSTLVDRLSTAAGLEGAVVSRAQCYDLEQEIPYATLSNLIQGLLDRPGVSATPPEALAELALLVKDVRRRFSAIPVAIETHGETARLRLTDAILQMLEAIAEDHPVIIVVDDLHLCDDASLAVLHLVAHRVSIRPIMLVFVARTEELPRSPSATRLRASAARLQIKEVVLPPLSEQECSDILNSLLGATKSAFDPSLRRSMIRSSGGFPMILELLVQDWFTNGGTSLALALESITADFGGGTDAPPLYKQVFERLSLSLDAGTRHVLNVAAVLGRRLNDITFYALADIGQGQVMAAMADLVRFRILRDAGRGLEFINEFVRAAAYLEVPPTVRRAIHTAVAERLMEEEKRGTRFLGLEIAWHTTRAGNVAEMPIFLLRGAQEAIAQGALDAASRALSSALPQLALGDRESAALLLAEALQEQGRWTESATALAESRGESSSSLRTVFAILAEQRTVASAAQRLRSDILRLHTIVNEATSQRVRLKAASAAGQLMGEASDRGLASSILGSLSSIARSELTEDEERQLDLCQAQLLYYAGKQMEALVVLKELVTRLRTDGISNSTLVRAHAGLGVVRCHEGHYEIAREDFAAGYSLAIQIGNESQMSLLAAQIALCSLRLGEYADQLEWSKKATEVGSPGWGYRQVQLAYYHAFALAMTGETRAAIERFAADHSLIPIDSAPWLMQTSKLLRADILFICGQEGAAISQAKEGLEMPRPVLRSPFFAGTFARWLAVVAEREGLLDELRPHIAELGRKVDDFDALDRAEIICACLIVGDSGVASQTLEDRLRRQFAELPPAVITQLTKLGLIRPR
jgi:DNA-binding SARP family transcriptional activator/Cdc6-like AAA superfamily ATPase/tetratricopeptide (TPR) repeat protein